MQIQLVDQHHTGRVAQHRVAQLRVKQAHAPGNIGQQGHHAALEHNQLEQARVCLQQLRADAPDIPELAGAAALLRRKEVLGR